jgi:hypothetical protein
MLPTWKRESVSLERRRKWGRWIPDSGELIKLSDLSKRSFPANKLGFDDLAKLDIV